MNNTKKNIDELAKPQKRNRHLRRFLRVFFIISAFIIVVHIAVPPVALYFVNKKLKTLPGYNGHIGQMQLNLFTGSVTIQNIKLEKKNGKIPVPFTILENLKLTLDWPALKKRKLAVAIDVNGFMVNVVQGPTEETSQKSIDPAWIDFAKKMMPLDINTIHVKHGEIHYRNFHSSPEIDIAIDKIYLIGENLAGIHDKYKTLPSEAVFRANIYGATLQVRADMNLLEKPPAFDVNAEMKNLPLVPFNGLLKDLAKIDVERGSFSIFAEVAEKNGNLKGYTKAFIKNLKVLDLRKEKDLTLKDKIVEGFIDVAAWILKNKKTKYVATKIPVSGTIKQPYINVWTIIAETLVNAFIDALKPSLENSINIRQVGGDDDKELIESLKKK